MASDLDKGVHEVGPDAGFDPVHVVLSDLAREANGIPELLDDGDAARTQREVGVDASDVLGWERAVQVLGHELHEHLAGDAVVLDCGHVAIAPSK